MKMKLAEPKPEYEVAYQDLLALVNKHADKVKPIELLAIASNMVGKLIALQDQRVTTAEVVMEVVMRNIESGNTQIFEELMDVKGRG